MWCTIRLYSRAFVILDVNDLPLVSKCNTKLFADDTVLSLSNECFQQLNDNVKSEMSKINYWMRINKLFINYSKTKYRVISNKRQTCKGQVKIGKHKIEQVHKTLLKTQN